MRRLVAFTAILGMIAAPLAPLGAADNETADVYMKGDIQGPSFARATQCAGTFANALNATEEGSEDYKVSVKIGTAWLLWAQKIADGRDASAEMNAKIAAFNQRVQGLSPEGASAELAKDIKACQTIKTMMSTMEPFATLYADTVAGKPGFNTGVDCATTYSVIAQAIGEKDDNYDWYNDGVEIWTQYALDQTQGSDKQKIDAVTARAKQRGDTYTKLLTADQQSGLDRLAADRDTCKGLEQDLPKVFKNR